MPYEGKMRKIMSRKVCKAYLKPYSKVHTCQSLVKCLIYKGKRVSLICPELAENKRAIKENAKLGTDSCQTREVHSKLSCLSGVILQTLLCNIRHEKTEKQMCMLLDSGSQRSYVLAKSARELGMTSKGKVQLCHLLFGELKQTKDHQRYDLEIDDINNYPALCIEVLGHSQICERVPRLQASAWLSELKDEGVKFVDLYRPGDDDALIEVLIGSDYFARMMTGKIKHLSNELVTMETCCG